MFAWLRVCVLSCLVSVYSHLHRTLLPPPPPPLRVYIIPLIDFRLDYLSPTYSSQIRKHCSSYSQFNRLERGGGWTAEKEEEEEEGGEAAKLNVMNIMLTGGKSLHGLCVFVWN